MSGQDGLVRAVRIDLRRLHETWMELFFPRQREAGDTVLGKYTPDSTGGMVAYRVWGALGVVAVGFLYPFAVLGFATRYYARRMDGVATRMGIVGVVLLAAVVWGALTVVSLFQFSTRGFVAVGAASVVSTVSAALAVVFSRVGGRATSVLLAYPLGVTAVTMPPVVAAFFSTTLAALVFPNTETIAAWLLDNVLAAGGLAAFFRQNFELQGPTYAVLWFAFSVPVGWLLGLMVTLANAVRPTAE
jgi:hypothetical protein